MWHSEAICQREKKLTVKIWLGIGIVTGMLTRSIIARLKRG